MPRCQHGTRRADGRMGNGWNRRSPTETSNGDNALAVLRNTEVSHVHLPEMDSVASSNKRNQQVENAATACTILRTLLVPQMAIVEALRDASWPARYERIENVVIDAAHNPDGALALRNAIEQELVPSDRRAVVFGASQDKDWPELVNALRDWAPADRWFLCAAGLSRAADPALLRTKIHGEICSGVVDALTRARHVVGKDGLVVVFGSIFVGAEARAHLLGLTGDPLVGL